MKPDKKLFAKSIKTLYQEKEQICILEAFDFAVLKHEGQTRKSGEPFVCHPVAVAMVLLDYKMDHETIMAALLHDVIEDTDTTKEDIETIFGEKVAELVDGVTTLGTIDFSKLPSEDMQEAKFKSMIESLRKFFLAMAKDIRVVIIKLADRLHNMRTLSSLSEADQKRISRETLEIFAPLADRLGMGRIKAELEDLSFYYTNPKEYSRISKLLISGEKERKYYLNKINKIIENELSKNSIKAEIDGRVKHTYSLYKKLKKVDNDFTKIYDILAIRIIVENIESCYKALGIIHKLYKPMIYRIKDYISVPKPNGYQSLHTTVFGIGGNITEIQIRTKAMHEAAENGIAAHWHYDENKETVSHKGDSSFAPTNRLQWVNQLMDWQKSITDSEELQESLRIDFFNDRLFISSPSGDIFDLPEGSTPIDFAYEIHSQIGDRCRGAKVNGKMVNLDHRLLNRDVVEIILASKSDKSGPSRDWLDFVTTVKARQHIRSWYRKKNRDQNIDEGHKLLSQELSIFGLAEVGLKEEQTKEIVGSSGWKEWEDILAAIGDGSVTARQVTKKLVGAKLYLELEDKNFKPIITTGKSMSSLSTLEGILIRYGECCKPQRGDDVKGFITRGRGITIHRSDCKNLLTISPERIIDLDMEVNNQLNYEVEIISENRVGVLRDISQVFTSANINIENFQNVRNDEGDSVINMTLCMDNPMKLADTLPKINSLKGVKTVRHK
ncbi:MAG: bifunctional (p)ppGpp synthetase/guanosine-3',5'-bis(diphosphate) 3'-pyrophosphohydrolase [bacterium]